MPVSEALCQYERRSFRLCFAAPQAAEAAGGEKGIYPAVDPLESTSRILEADVVGEEHYEVARKVQEILQK